MHHWQQLSSLVCLLGVFFYAPITPAAKLEDSAWITVKSNHYKIYSLLDEASTLKLVKRLELLRASVPRLAPIEVSKAPVPTNIYAFKKRRDFTQFGLPKDTVGHLIPGLRDNTIVLRGAGRLSESAVVLHEYTHFLIRNNSRQLYPRWFDEGYAEYFGSSKLVGDVFRVGLFPDYFKNNFKKCDWVPMAHIVATDLSEVNKRYDHDCMFYPQSWALVHYIQNLPDNVAKLEQYLHLVESGTDSVAAIETVFDTTIFEFDQLIEDYVKASKFKHFDVPHSATKAPTQYEVSSLSREQASLALAGLALRLGKLNEAGHWFSVAAKDKQLAAQAHSGLGDVLKFSRQFDEALPYYQRAVELDPADIYVRLDHAQYWHSLAIRQEPGPAQDDLLTKARVHFSAAQNINDKTPEVHAGTGASYLHQGDFSNALAPLETAHSLMPSSERIRLDLAITYAGLDRFGDAANLAQTIVAWSHKESTVSVEAGKLLDQIDIIQAERGMQSQE